MASDLLRNAAAPAPPQDDFQIGKIMGQLRTANKRHKRAIALTVKKAVAESQSPPAKAVSVSR